MERPGERGDGGAGDHGVLWRALLVPSEGFVRLHRWQAVLLVHAPRTRIRVLGVRFAHAHAPYQQRSVAIEAAGLNNQRSKQKKGKKHGQ
eukprot:6194064-Pleurochrysis_carterae.AAC.1